MNISRRNREPLSLTGAAIVVAFFSVASRALGLVRDRLLAATFGAGGVLDAYYAAFKLPDFIFNTFVLGALAAAFIPVFVRYRSQQGSEAAWRLGAVVMNVLVVFLILCAVGAFALAPWFMPVLAPGFDAAGLALATQLTRYMLVAVVVFGASHVIGSILQAERRFVAFALAPVLYNLGIILGLFVFVPRHGAVGLAYGVVLGSCLHLLVQLPALLRTGFRWRPTWGFKHAGLKEVMKLLAPRTLGLVASQINQIVTVSFVSRLAVGSLAAFTLASNLQSFPINVFGVSLAVAAFPIFSQALSNNNAGAFIQHFNDSLRRILFYVIPLAVLFLVLRAQLVRVVLGSGAFDWSDTIQTAQVLGFLALAIVADSVIPLVARAFYALHDTRTPMLAGLASIALNLTLLMSLRSFGLAGVGLAYVSSSVLNLVILLSVLGGRLSQLQADDVLKGLRPMVVASLVAGAAAYGTLRLVAPLVDMDTFVGIFVQGASAGLLGVVSYFALALVMRLPEVEFLKRWLRAAWAIASRPWSPQA